MRDFTLRVKQARRIRAREETQAGRDASKPESTTQMGAWMRGVCRRIRVWVQAGRCRGVIVSALGTDNAQVRGDCLRVEGIH